MRILIVEDQPDILRNIADFLAIRGYLVDCAYDGLGGLHLALSNPFDLIILDVNLPGIDGYSFCEKLRQDAQITTPVIMLTARDSVDDRLTGFRSGADDYLVKPFALAELAARVEAVLRRSSGGISRQLQVCDLVFNLDTLAVRRDGLEVKLSPIGYKLLEKLMKSSPNVVRREVLEEFVWGADIPDSDSLRSHIHQLRQAIDKPFARPLLKTVHGIGFCLKDN